MGGEAGNFDFLEEYSPQLAKLGRLAERYFFDDPPTALVKLRQFAEITAKEVAARQALLDDRRVTFDEVLSTLRSRADTPDLVGIGLRGPKKDVDKAIKGARLHP